MTAKRPSVRTLWALNLLAAWFMVGCLNTEPPLAPQRISDRDTSARDTRRLNRDGAPAATEKNEATQDADRGRESHPSQWRKKTKMRYAILTQPGQPRGTMVVRRM
ncbi:MAG: hypothetical protein HUU22_16660 [Phycisphaerae bacterium]|nr:hypothetical protein [Phycisphaerae bacterium]NUQ47652.1 hypothetical protein [Phycisphaerae bacterium]